jgi:hypothetical protein
MELSTGVCLAPQGISWRRRRPHGRTSGWHVLTDLAYHALPRGVLMPRANSPPACGPASYLVGCVLDQNSAGR